jgi:GNAT superfamily N-acetyltransferase
VADWSVDDAAWFGPTGRPIAVDRATPADAEEAARVHTASAAASYRGIAPPERGGLARRTGVWREILADPASRSFVARDAGRMVGVLHIGPFRDHPHRGALRILYVLEAWWGSGAGQRLIDTAHAELARDYEEAVLTVLAANARARRFYERNGWRLAETLVEPHFGGIPTEVARYRRSMRAKAGSKRPA